MWSYSLPSFKNWVFWKNNWFPRKGNRRKAVRGKRQQFAAALSGNGSRVGLCGLTSGQKCRNVNTCQPYSPAAALIRIPVGPRKPPQPALSLSPTGENPPMSCCPSGTTGSFPKRGKASPICWQCREKRSEIWRIGSRRN